jgi:hypothetical protein
MLIKKKKEGVLPFYGPIPNTLGQPGNQDAGKIF